MVTFVLFDGTKFGGFQGRNKENGEKVLTKRPLMGLDYQCVTVQPKEMSDTLRLLR